MSLPPRCPGGAAGYPAPIGDHVALARAARERLWSLRRGPAYRAAANEIQARHGSRRSGMRQVSARRPRAAAQAPLPFGE